MKYGKFIKEQSKEQGKSLGELAEKLGISRQALWQRLNRDMSVSHLEEMLEWLGYEIRIGKKG